MDEPIKLLVVNEQSQQNENIDNKLFYHSDSSSEVSGLTKFEYEKWKRAVLVICYISIASQLVLGIIAIVAGLEVDSSGTFGFGVECIIDLLTTAVVLWRFSNSNSSVKESSAVIVLSILIIFLSLSVVDIAMETVSTKLYTVEEIRLLVISVSGMIVFSALAGMKFYVAKKVKSTAVFLDAMSSASAAAIGFGLLLSLAVYHYTKLRFLDSIIACIIAVTMVTYATWTLYNALRQLRNGNGNGDGKGKVLS